MLKEQGDKVSAEDRGNIETAVSGLRDALKGDDAEAIKRTMENLTQSSHKVAEAMYKAASDAQAAPGGEQAAPAPEAPDEDKGGGDDVIDAEYEVKE